MKISKAIFLLFATIFSFSICDAKIANSKTEMIIVSGNCEMCRSRIEKAVKQKGISYGVWNMDTKILSVFFNAKKTTIDVVLKLVANAGYDNEKFSAPDQAYEKLPGCCRYDRIK